MALALRGFNVIRGMLGRVVLWFERRNPEALLENEKENLQRLMVQFNAGLVEHAAVAARLDSQIARNGKQAETLQYRVKVLLGSGDRAAAAREALALKELRAQIEADTSRRAESEATYRRLVARRDSAVAESRSRIEAVRRQIGDLKVSRAIADLEGMAQAMVGDLDRGGASLSRLEELVSEELDRAQARARVAQSASTALPMSDAVRDAMAEDALAEFLGDTPAIPDLRPLGTGPDAAPADHSAVSRKDPES